MTDKLFINDKEIGTVNAYHRENSPKGNTWIFELDEGFTVAIPCKHINNWSHYPNRLPNICEWIIWLR